MWSRTYGGVKHSVPWLKTHKTCRLYADILLFNWCVWRTSCRLFVTLPPHQVASHVRSLQVIFALEEEGKHNQLYLYIIHKSLKRVGLKLRWFELCEIVQTSQLSSQGATSLKSCFQVDWKANRATALSNTVAGSFRAQTPLPDSGNIKTQSHTTWWILPCMIYKNYLPSSRLSVHQNLQF